jgi:hypothetical protein
MHVYRPFPPDRAALEALARQIEATINDLTTYRDNLEEYHRAGYLLGHPRCPAEARARLKAEAERIRPLVTRRPTVAALVASYLTPHSVDCLNGGLSGLRVALADLAHLHRDAIETLAELRDSPNEGKRQKSSSGHETTKRFGAGDPSLLILSALNYLAQEGVWDIPSCEIIAQSGVPRSTYYDVLKKDKDVKKAMLEYRRRQLGKGPAYADDL